MPTGTKEALLLMPALQIMMLLARVRARALIHHLHCLGKTC